MAISKIVPKAVLKDDEPEQQTAKKPTSTRGGGGGTWAPTAAPTTATSPTLYPSMVPATKPNKLNPSQEQLDALNDLISTTYPSLPKISEATEEKTQKQRELERIEQKKSGMSAEELEAMERRGIETQLEAINNGDAEMTEEFMQTLIKYGYMEAPDISRPNGLPLSPQEQLGEQQEMLAETLPEFGKADPFWKVREQLQGITGTGTEDEAPTTTEMRRETAADTPKSEDSNEAAFDIDSYDPATEAAYLKALEALQAARNETPIYKGTHDERLNEIYQEIIGRKPFQYDAADDVMYQQYLDAAQRNGQLAMRDTMGQAATMTGGYGNSYAASAGNQAFLAYMEDVNNMLPEFYDMARDDYDAEGERLMAEYALTDEMADEEYNRYLDSLDEHYRRIDLLKEEADDAYNRKIYEEKTAYERAMDAYDRMAERITKSGQMPSEADLAAVGMSREEAEGYYDIYRREAEKSGEPTDGFTGTTHAEAVAYMQKNGVPAQLANMLVSEEDWNAAKKSGSTAYEVAAYDSYAAFLADAVADAIANYGE